MKNFLGLFLVTALFAAPAQAAEPLRLQLKWLPQTQFAGYYVAQALGYYSDAGVEVQILPGATDFAPAERLAAGKADIAIEWLPAAMIARDFGLRLVNVAQPFAQAGFAFTCLRAKVPNLARLKGARIGIWEAGNEYPALALLAAAGLNETDVTLVTQIGAASELLKTDQADCVSTMTYNEAQEVLRAGIPAEDIVAYDAAAFGTVLLEDGLFVQGEMLVDPDFADQLRAFVTASMRGWARAQADPEEAARIVIEIAGLSSDRLEEQTQMMREVSALLGDGPALDQAAFETAAELLVTAGLIAEAPKFEAVAQQLAEP